jgi:hypothetical protein
MLIIFIYFCAIFFGDVHVAHQKIKKDEKQQRHQQKT